MTITIYHNPDCGTSRNTLAMIRQSGEAPVVIEYLKDPPNRARLQQLIAAMGITVRGLLRKKNTPYHELGLDDPQWTDDQLLDLMRAHPILINRPIVETPKGVRLCRPSERVLDILPNPNIGPFAKEDGAVVIEAEGAARCLNSPAGRLQGVNAGPLQALGHLADRVVGRLEGQVPYAFRRIRNLADRPPGLLVVWNDELVYTRRDDIPLHAGRVGK
jgi:arsenate reductase (glutaredoxin)